MKGERVPGAWNQISIAEQLATAGTGTVNALYFAGRALRIGGPRRGAALVLTALFAGSALDAAARLALGDNDVAAAAVRLPLLAANLAAFSLILAGAGR